MKWEMEEVEAVLEKIWDLHDKLSDAIHSISRSHFLHSLKALRNSTELSDKAGFVYIKHFPIQQHDAIHDAKSLNSIRTALENLEDHLHFFHTVQTQQRAERDAAIAGLEQSRMVLALRLADHHGRKYKVIEEARAFVGEVENHDAKGGYMWSAESNDVGKRSNMLVKVVICSFKFARKSLKVDHLGNAALFAVSMLALLQLHQVADNSRERYYVSSDLQQVNNKLLVDKTKVYVPEGGGSSSGLDVLSGRG